MHRITVEMIPDAQLEQKNLMLETKKMETVKQSWSPEERHAVVRAGVELRRAQMAEDSPEALQSLPRLTLDDIDRMAKTIPSHVSSIPRLRDSNDGAIAIDLLTHDLETAGIIYADVLFDYSGIDLNDIELLPLLARLFMESGTSKWSDIELGRGMNFKCWGSGKIIM
jgi:Zn-dependent M16 (insulinase) family peptidase